MPRKTTHARPTRCLRAVWCTGVGQTSRTRVRSESAHGVRVTEGPLCAHGHQMTTSCRPLKNAKLQSADSTRALCLLAPVDTLDNALCAPWPCAIRANSDRVIYARNAPAAFQFVCRRAAPGTLRNCLALRTHYPRRLVFGVVGEPCKQRSTCLICCRRWRCLPRRWWSSRCATQPQPAQPSNNIRCRRWR